MPIDNSINCYNLSNSQDNTLTEPPSTEKPLSITPPTKYTSNITCLINIICVVAGSGILGLPYALKLGGWISLIVFVIAGMMAIHTGKMLISSLYLPKGKLRSYPAIGFEAFGTPGRWVVTIVHYSNLLCGACIYIMLSGLNVFQLLQEAHIEPGLGKKVWILLAGIIIGLPTLFVKTIREATILTVLGMLSTLVVVGVVTAFGIVEIPQLTNIEYSFINITTLPMAIGTVAFAYGGNNVYPHIESTMKPGKGFNNMLTLAMIVITVLYILTASMGYAVFGNSVQSPVLNSLPDSLYKIASIILITLHVALAAPIFVCSFCTEIEDSLKTPPTKLKEIIQRLVIRILTLIFVTTIAIYMPYFNDFMALFGSISMCSSVFIFPILLHYKLFGWKGRSLLDYVIDIFILVVGTMSLVLGTYDSTLALVKDFNS